MKTLLDNTVVTSRSHYYLLDCNNTNEGYFILNNFNKKSISTLTVKEYLLLFKHTTELDKIIITHENK